MLKRLSSFVMVAVLAGVTYTLWDIKGRIDETTTPPKETVEKVEATIKETDGNSEVPVDTTKGDTTENTASAVQANTGNTGGTGKTEKTTTTTVPATTTTTTPLYTEVADPRTSPDDFQAGIALIAYRDDYENIDELEWKTDKILDRLAESRANSISINIPLYQDSFRSSEVYKDTEHTPTEREVGFIIRRAQVRGFSVMLRPFLDEQSISYDERGRYTGEWRGTIRPQDPEQWFETYNEVLLGYAQLAEKEGVDILNIGTELTSMEKFSQKWEDLIEEIRNIYGGRLTYSANRVLSDEMPWHALDMASVDAFYFLDVGDDPTEEELVEAWQPWIRDITEKLEEIQKPLVITELGTAAQKGSFRRSWIWDHKTPLDQEAQSLFYKTACLALKKHTTGIYWWAANIWLHEDPEQDPSFNPLGKPAEQEIRSCFS